MPIPSPEGSKDKKTFIAKCMDSEVMKKEYPDPKQRSAICFSKWGKSKGMIEIDFSDKIRRLKDKGNKSGDI